MSSLQFLNKKSWHVGTRKNEEKVWLREQAAQKEAARVAELQKQLDEERKLEEVRRLETQSGTVPKRAPCVDWMYEGPGAAMPGTEEARKAAEADAAAAREAALLGKIEAVLPAGVEAGGATPGTTAEDEFRNELALRDAEVKLRDDPMLAILQRKALEAERRGARLHVSAVTDAESKEPQSIEDSVRKAEKLARKQERARIREERRIRREERAAQREGSVLRSGDSSRDTPFLDEREDRYEMSAPPFPVHGDRGGAREASPPRDLIARRKRPRSDFNEDGVDEPWTGSAVTDSQQASDGSNGYGLVVPSGGSRLAVKSRFDPKACLSRSDSRRAERVARDPSARPPLPRRKEDLDALRAQMQRDATVLDSERSVRLRKHRRELEKARPPLSGNDGGFGPVFMRDFARDVIAREDRCEKGATALRVDGDRGRAREASPPRDFNAARKRPRSDCNEDGMDERRMSATATD